MDRLTDAGCTCRMSDEMTLVTGGTGKTGRRVAQRLADRGVPVRVGSRSGAPRFDWEDPDTWAPALAGVDAVYLAFQPDLASFLAGLFGSFHDGHNAHVADGVQRALGREPRDFAEYARAAAATGVWNAE